MRKHWVTAVVVGAVAMATAAPAWAGCKTQAVLTGNHFGTGTAEKKMLAATLKAAAVNKFEVDVTGAGANVMYAVMISHSAIGPFDTTPIGAFMTNSLGTGEFDVSGRSDTCDIQRVQVVSFPGGVNTLSGKFGVLVNDDAPEVQNEIQIEVENEVNNLIQNEIQLEPQPNNP